MRGGGLLKPAGTNWTGGPPAEIHQIRMLAIDWPFGGDNGNQMISDTCIAALKAQK
jgi:hypothetical protein